MKLSEYLEPDLVGLDLPGSNKGDVLSELVELLAGRGIVHDAPALLATLEEREGLGSTGIGHGVAIPHGRCAELTRAAVAFGRTAGEVDFTAIDGKPTRLFFLLVAPEGGTQEHLHILAKIARLTRNANTREQLLVAESPSRVLEVIDAAEGS